MDLTSEKVNTGFADLRSALLNWYPFPGGERALLLGRDTLALRKLLEKHYDRTDTQIIPDEKYDCIVAADLLEETEAVREMLSDLYTHLNDSGVFLLAFRNRFGVKYLCGGTDEFVRIPFSSLSPAGKIPRLYARKEMDDLLTAAGFKTSRYYYLMPDSSFVQAVYTDEYLPNDSIQDRVMPFDLFDSPLVAWEGDLYDDIVRENTLPNLTNVYLAECRKTGVDDSGKHVIYAALSTDRGEEHGFSTILYSDGTALKAPLYSSGKKALEILFSNVEELRAKGILTVPQELTSEGIKMPLIREEALLHFLRRKLTTDPEAFLAVFDEIEKDVMRASPLTKKLPEDLSEIWGADADTLGPVLERAWIDMIPYNAFWADGRIRYYDQEFVVENCPAKYVLFRALFYTWIHIKEAEKVLPLDSVKERFGMKKLWKGFFQREMRFVSDNRNWDSFAEIYDHNKPDRKKIADRIAALSAYTEK